MELWEFEIWPAVADGEIEIRKTAMKLRQKFLMILGLYYTADMSPKKMSFVVTNARLYEFLVSIFEGVAFDDIFSLILIDLEKAKIEQEYVFPIKGRPDVPLVFFPIEEAEEDSENQEELNDVVFDEL
jgi:hypothetical protein